MSQKELFRFDQHHLRGYSAAGVAGGASAGLLIAFLESLFLLVSVGPFGVDFLFLLKALLLYGLVGGLSGCLLSVFLYFVFFRRHPMRKVQPWAFFFALLSAFSLGAETLFYLMDIHTFRNLEGEWNPLAYIVFFGGVTAAGLFGWMINGICGNLFRGAIRKRLRNGGIVLLLFVSLFLLARGFIIFREGSQLHGSPAVHAKNPPNIIMLLVDSLRPDHLSAYGYPLPTSPEIDRLAREGVLFRNCYAASNWTVPTHTSLFTGLYPSAHGNYSLYSSLDPSIPTLAQLLAGSGYRTASFFDNKLLGSRYGLARGFQTALGVDNEHKTSLTILRLWQRLRKDRSMSKTILQVAARWIEYGSARRQPFFLFVNFLDAHIPYRPRQPYIGDFLRSLPDKKVNIELARKFTTDEGNSKKAADELYLRLSAADWNWLARFYDSNIRAIDDQIHLFLKRLRAKGILENTLLIITSDHGEFFGERGIGGHLHSSLHNAGLRIPLICWFPERLPPGRVEQPVSQVDVFPTIREMAGLPAALFPNVQGRDLFSRPEGRELLAEFWDDILKRFSRAFFSGDAKLVVTTSGKKELYDLKKDPGEKTDLARRFPGLLAGLALRLEKFLRSMPQRKNREEPEKKKDMGKMLKSLGYL